MPSPLSSHGAQVVNINELLQKAEQPLSVTEKKTLADQFCHVAKNVSAEEAQRLTATANNLYKQMTSSVTQPKAGGTAGAQMVAAQFNTKPVNASSDFFRSDLNPFQQWLYWETSASFKEVRRPYRVISMDVVHAPKSAVAFRGVNANQMPSGILETFQKNDHVMWPKHPNNTLSALPTHLGKSIPIPYADSAANETWKAWHTASRSMIIESPDSKKLLSVKLPTNFPTPHAEEAHKTNLVNHTDIAIRRGDHLIKANARGIAHPELTLQPDVLAVYDKDSKNGFTVRDISSFIDDEHFYMPGFALPLYGAEMKISSDELLGKIAPIWGRSKALLLMRYGMYLKSPHGQNTVFQLDQTRQITGHVTLRDLSDTSFVGPVASALGYRNAVNADQADGYTVGNKIEQDWSLSIPGLDHNGYFNYSQLADAKGAHDQAFIDTVFEELSKANPSIQSKKMACASLSDLQNFLFSDEGQIALENYGKSVLGL